MIKHNTKSSRELLEVLKSEDNILGIIPDKELFNRSTLDKNSLVSMKEDRKIFLKQKKFFDEIEQIFNTIKDRV